MRASSVAFDDVGHGEPALLCLPGWCADRTAFRELVALCGARRTLALDWRGHGESAAADGDFGVAELVDDAMEVVQRSGIDRFVPVATAHAGWVAIELRRRLGARVPAIVLVDWLVLEPPPPFVGALAALQAEDTWMATRDRLFAMWLEGVADADVIRFVREAMSAYGFDMWARGGREIAAAYAREGSPLQALARLQPPARVLHLYAQPTDAGFLAAQQTFAAKHPWFAVHRVAASSHFPTIEIPQAMATAIEEFTGAA